MSGPSGRAGPAWLVAFGVIIAGATLLVTQTRPDMPEPELLGPSWPAAPAASGAPAVATLPRQTIAAGLHADNKTWQPTFAIWREGHLLGRTYLDAHDACRRSAAWLCSEPQWRRACQLAPELGSIEAWTASIADGGAVVMGGAAGCGQRQVRATSESAPARATICCERSIALVSHDSAESFRKTASVKLARFERAQASGDAGQLSRLLDEQLEVRGKPIERQRYVAQAAAYFREHQDHWVMHERCETRTSEVGWVADCTVIAYRDGELAKLLRRFERGAGDEGLVQRISEPKILRAFSPP